MGDMADMLDMYFYELTLQCFKCEAEETFDEVTHEWRCSECGAINYVAE